MAEKNGKIIGGFSIATVDMSISPKSLVLVSTIVG